MPGGGGVCNFFVSSHLLQAVLSEKLHLGLQEMQTSGDMELFPSLDLNRMEALPSINLDCLLDHRAT